MGAGLRRDDLLLHAQRHKAQFAVAVGDQQQHRLLAVLLQLADALLDVGGAAHGFLCDLDDDIAGREPFFGGIRIAVDAGNDNALDAILDLVLAAQILAQDRKVEAKRLLRHQLFGRLFLGFRGGLLHLLGVLEAAEPDLSGFLFALADDDDLDVLADSGIGNDAREILWILDVLAVELDDDIAGLDACRLCRSLVIDAGDQRAARGLDIEAFGELVGDLLDANAEPAAAELAELPELIDHGGNRLGGHGE